MGEAVGPFHELPSKPDIPWACELGKGQGGVEVVVVVGGVLGCGRTEVSP